MIKVIIAIILVFFSIIAIIEICKESGFKIVEKTKIKTKKKNNNSIINFKRNGMNVCVVNGKRYELPDGSISIINNEIYVNNKKYVDGNDFKEKTLNITIQGNVGSIESPSGSITVEGNAKTVSSTSGNITIKNGVTGNVSTTSGDVEINGDVSGDVRTMSGDVRCGNIQGEAKSMSGDISSRYFF